MTALTSENAKIGNIAIYNNKSFPTFIGFRVIITNLKSDGIYWKAVDPDDAVWRHIPLKGWDYFSSFDIEEPAKSKIDYLKLAREVVGG